MLGNVGMSNMTGPKERRMELNTPSGELKKSIYEMEALFEQ